MGCPMIWLYELQYTEKNSQQYVVLYTEMRYTGISNSGYLLSGTCRQKLSVEWH